MRVPPWLPPAAAAFAIALGVLVLDWVVIDIDLGLSARAVPPTEPPDSYDGGGGGGDRDKPPDRAELEALLRTHKGVVANVARAMQRSRKQVYRWIEQHGLDVAAYR